MRPMVRGPTPINILLVEDDPSDVELTRRALQRAKLQNRVWIVGAGVGDRANGTRAGLDRSGGLLSGLHLENPPTLAAAHPLGRLSDRDAVGAVGADCVALA